MYRIAVTDTHPWFLVADTQLYTLACRSVGRLVGRSVASSVQNIFELRAVFALLLVPNCPYWITVHPASFIYSFILLLVHFFIVYLFIHISLKQAFTCIHVLLVGPSVDWLVTHLFDNPYGEHIGLLGFLVVDTRLYTLQCRSVRPSVGRSVTFLNSDRFSHYCSCPTVRDWTAVYPALLGDTQDQCGHSVEKTIHSKAIIPLSIC